jgi:hypothetical protein
MALNPIETAVAPLKADAIARAEQEVATLVANVTRALEAANWDRAVAAPYPNARQSRASYQQAMTKVRLFASLTRSLAISRMMHEPDYCRIVPELVEHFTEQARRDAAFQYEAFVAKLVKKIGDVADASLHGNHVWSYSILTVTLADDSRQTWKTQQIVNVSKLGKLFNQWPTRKLKGN